MIKVEIAKKAHALVAAGKSQDAEKFLLENTKMKQKSVQRIIFKMQSSL
jgi:hypothetical protein